MWEFSLVANIYSETTKIAKITKISEKYCVIWTYAIWKHIFIFDFFRKKCLFRIANYF